MIKKNEAKKWILSFIVYSMVLYIAEYVFKMRQLQQIYLASEKESSDQDVSMWDNHQKGTDNCGSTLGDETLYKAWWREYRQSSGWI